MSYDVERNRLGRHSVSVLEIQADFCQNTFGVAPCQAVLNGPGSECFNTFGTCQDTLNYNKGSKSYWFITNTAQFPEGENFCPTIEKVDISPSKIDRNNFVGAIGRVQITLKDHPYHDRGIDPYFPTRLQNPIYNGKKQEEVGTYWGRWLARNPFYEGRIAKLWTGFLTEDGFDISNFESRTYVLDRINGPDRNGKVTVILKDVLKFTNDERANAPLFTPGELVSDLPEVQATGTFQVSDVTGYDTVIKTLAGDITNSSTYVRINDEIIETTFSGDTFTIIDRGAFDSEISDHDANDTIQFCTYYENINIIDVVYDLVVNPNYSNIDTAYVNTADWNELRISLFGTATITALITEPESVFKLLGEISEQFQMYIVWREKEQLIQIGSNVYAGFNECEVPEEEFTFTSDCHILEQTVKIKRKPQDRITSVRIYFDPRTYTDSLDEPNTYRRVFQFTDTDSEGPNAFDDKKTKVIFSRWLKFSNQAFVNSLAARLVNRRKRSPVEIQWQVDARHADRWTGDFVQVLALEQQDEYGNIFSPFAQITSVKEQFPGSTRYTYTAEFDTVPELANPKFACIAPADCPDYENATDLQKCQFGFIGDDTDFPDNNCYTIL